MGLMREPRREQLSRVNGTVVAAQFTRHRPAATIVRFVTAASSIDWGRADMVDISQQPDKAKLSSSVYVSPSLVVSRSQYSIRAGISDTKFPHVSRSWRRRYHRSSSTSSGNDISLSSMHDSDEDPNLPLSEHQLDSSPEPLQPQPQVTSSQPSNEIGRPCANSARLTRVPRFKSE